jgi:hypothetical protein
MDNKNKNKVPRDRKEYQKQYYLKNSLKLKNKRKEYYANNIENVKISVKKYTLKNIDKIKEYQKTYNASNSDKIKNYHKKYRFKNLVKIKNYYRNNKEKILEQKKQYEKHKRNTDAQYNLIRKLRIRLNKALKTQSVKKCYKTIDLLGITIDELKKYLESQFKDGMTWDNYGYKDWHIDHIRPCSSFDLSDLEQQKQCFHYTNLQPLWWWENLKKSNKVVIEE